MTAKKKKKKVTPIQNNLALQKTLETDAQSEASNLAKDKTSSQDLFTLPQVSLFLSSQISQTQQKHYHSRRTTLTKPQGL